MSDFWRSVRELAALRDNIPEERRALSGVRRAMREDVLPDIIRAAAKRFDERPRYRASIEAQRELEDLPTNDAAYVRRSMVHFFSYPFKNPVERLDTADRIIRSAVEFGVSTRAFLQMLMEEP